MSKRMKLDCDDIVYNEGHTEGASSGMCVYGCKLLEWWGVLIHMDWIVSLLGDSYCSCLTSSNVAGNTIAPKPASCRQSFASHFCCSRLFDQSDKCETLSERVNQLHSVFNYIASSQSNHTLR